MTRRQPMTLERIKSRCLECGACWQWTGSTSGTCPKIAWWGEHGREHRVVRRIVWELAKGPIPEGMLVTVNCGNSLCLNPAHLELTTRAEVTRKNSAKAAVQLRRRASSARTAQAKFGKITMDIAREIRLSDKTGRQLARELEVSPSLVSKVRLNKSWIEPQNPFSFGLGART